jgi:hypothetical protein
MQHLTEEQLVSHHYRDADAPAWAKEHLAACGSCAAQYDTLRRVLALVSDAPVPERGSNYGEEVWNRLRWKLGANRRRRGWQSALAAAAMIAIVFLSGYYWRARRAADEDVAAVTAPTATMVASNEPDHDRTRILLLVVGDHLDTSQRVLLEVANANPDAPLDNSTQQKRAEDLVSANRIYRLAAVQRGDERIAQLLTDLEPILIEVSHAGATLEGKQLTDLQKRIESKGLLFKVRVTNAPTPTTDTL